MLIILVLSTVMKSALETYEIQTEQAQARLLAIGIVIGVASLNALRSHMAYAVVNALLFAPAFSVFGVALSMVEGTKLLIW